VPCRFGHEREGQLFKKIGGASEGSDRSGRHVI
jgi:hypothetical protein